MSCQIAFLLYDTASVDIELVDSLNDVCMTSDERIDSIYLRDIFFIKFIY